MKKNKKILLLLPALIVIGLAGCHSCPPPEESLECYPVCKKIKQENAKNARQEWENFKRTPVVPYVPTRRYAKIDLFGRMLSKLSFQVKHEIVIPYIEMDRNGLICGYREFEMTVNATMEARKCDCQTATKLVLEDWMRQPGGPAKCRRLVQAIPILQRLRTRSQIRIAVQRLEPEVLHAIELFHHDPTFSKELNLLQSDFRSLHKDQRAASQMVQTIASAFSVLRSLTELNASIGFLNVYFRDQNSQRRAMEKFILDLTKDSLRSNQHNQ